MDNITYSNIITCPNCGSRSKEVMPENACQYFWQCPKCKTILKPLQNDCCVYCSYGDIVCPPKQMDSNNDNNSDSANCC